MKVITDEVRSDVTVKENSQYNHVNAANMCVEANVQARIYGVIKNLILKKGSIVTVHGKITGKIENNGGTLNVYEYRD